MTRQAILWDMDGTLLDSEPAHAAAFDEALRELGLRVSGDFQDRLLGASDDQVHALLVEATGATLTLSEWRAVKWRYFERNADRIVLRDAVAALARRLAEGGVPMAVVSNSTADEVAFCLRVSGLARLFSLTISRADVENGKPAPDGYLLAASRLGVPPASCVVVEDSPLGSRAGLAAGMTVLYHPQHAVCASAIPGGARYVAPDQPLDSFLPAFSQEGEFLS